MLYLSLLKHKANEYLRFHQINRNNRKILGNQNMTIICNNCLGGFILHDLGLEFKTPTINLYIDIEDYLLFLENFQGFLNCELKEVQNPKYLEWMQPGKFPVGMLELRLPVESENQIISIPIYFIHYSTFQQAKECWDRRKKRINQDNIFVIFQLDRVCDGEILKRFESLHFTNKICLTFDSGGKKSRYLYKIRNRKGYSNIWDYQGFNGKRYYDQFDYISWLMRGGSMSMKKKVIIVVDCFNVDKLVGARRMTALASFLMEKGIKPYVVTTHPDIYKTTVESESLEKIILPVRVISIKFRLLYTSKIFGKMCERVKKHRTLYEKFSCKVKMEERNSLLSTVLRIYNRMLLTLDNLRADFIYEKALTKEKANLGKRYAKEIEKIISTSADKVTIITSVGGLYGYFEEGPIEMMKFLLRKKANVEWIYDMRDKLHSYYASDERNRIAVETERFIYENAKYIITISYGEMHSLANALGLKIEEADKIKVVYNGFETKEPTDKYNSDEQDMKILNIVYTGKAYLDKLHPDMLFEAIGQLISEGLVSEKLIRFHYAGSDSAALLKIAKQYACENIYVGHGYVNLKIVKKLQSNADLLFAMTKNIGCDIGCIAYKIMEYLGSYIPIIVIVTGDVPNSEIKDIINETKAGISLDDIDYNSNLKILKEYLLLQYLSKRFNGRTTYIGDKDVVMKYSCQQQFMNYISFL